MIKETIKFESKFEDSKTPPIKNEETLLNIEKIVQREIKENEESKKEEEPEKKKQKMIITGDDILIEYVNRLIKHLESICTVFHKKYSQKIE